MKAKIDFTSPLAHGQILDRWRPDRIVGAVSGEEWREYAECIGVDPRLFTLEGPEQTGLKGPGKNRKYNEEKFEIAVTYCNACQVKTACKVNALAYGDTEFTMRAGINPYGEVERDSLDEGRLEAAWQEYFRGGPMERVRRAGKGPKTGPWSEWTELLSERLEGLPWAMWNGPDAYRTIRGRLMDPGGDYVYIVQARGNTYERMKAPRGEITETFDGTG